MPSGPFDPGIGPGNTIGGAAAAGSSWLPGAALLTNFIGGIYNATQQNKINRQQLDFSREMYARQRADALADRAFENEYNSPAAQMARLKAAGLNPNLVYGHGAQAQGVSTRSSQAAAPSLRAPQIDPSMASAALSQMYDLNLRQAQTDNLKTAMQIAQQEMALKAAQTAKVIADTKTAGIDQQQKEFNLSQARALQTVSIDTAKAGLQKILAETDKTQAATKFTLAENERQELMNAQNLQKGVEQILLYRASTSRTWAEKDRIMQSIELMKKEGVLRDFEISLSRKGITRNDPAYYRMAAEVVNAIQDSKIGQGFWNVFKAKFGLY